MSKNHLTVEHLKMACRHVQELMSAGVSENLAIRSLELFADVYAKLLTGGSATPHHVEQVPRNQWSIAAMKLYEDNPSVAARPGHYLRVEHGTPRREFARRVMKLYESGELTEPALAVLTNESWKLAVITLEEDAKLNKIARSEAAASPEERWALARIKF